MTSSSTPQKVSPMGSFKHRMLSMVLSVGAMTGAALLIVSTSVPANAFVTPESARPIFATEPVALEVQSVEWAPQAATTAEVIRDGYTATSLREQTSLLYANQSFFYSPSSLGSIRWPLSITVPISNGYGPREAPCAECSTFHRGVDFLAASGTPILAIADGVVVRVNDIDWSFGEHVLVEHVINGVRTQSLYAHMTVDTIRVSVGQALSVGDVVGLVGSTGQSVSPHLHFEVRTWGSAINAVPFMRDRGINLG